MKKKLLIILGIIIVVLLAVFWIFFYPKIIYNKDVSIIKNKISLVNDYFINNTGDIKEIKEELKKESTSSKRIEIEKETNSYLSNILDGVIKYKEKSFERENNMLLDEKFKDNLEDNLKYLNEEKVKLDSIKDDVSKLEEIDTSNIKDEDNKKLLKEIFDREFKIANYEKKVSDSIKYLESMIERFSFLNKNKNTWNYENGKIIFLKRSFYKEYQNISDGKEYELIKDTTGPVINGSDISIVKGSSVNIKDKVSCVDEVDDKVDCTIEGSYDINKIGTYTIKVTAKDESNNTSSKNIKLIVKEKPINTKPYYIEVIRNHNVVIVYGLDSNNQYTKIVKVFICSVGKATSKTPTGTFTTSDKSSWGWLVGNLYGQYYTRITGSILFHSVPYTKKSKDSLEWDEYNLLGTAASKGCVRMTVRDVKWIYDNCPRGTTVKIYDGNLPSGVVKPTAQKISGDSPNKGWDPTDPDKNNPWKK